MVNIDSVKKIYFVGIKGVAMSALAIICKEMGYTVTGSDIGDVFTTDKNLEKFQIPFFQEFSAQHIDSQIDLLVYGQSWSEKNEEIMQAQKIGVPCISESELRGILSSKKKTIAITGVHGKSTTTALIAHILSHARKYPSWLVGTSQIHGLGLNGHWDIGKYFIVEGDEYAKSKEDNTPKFLDLDPYISIITSVEWEHVDVYKNVSEMEIVFSRLIEKTKKKVIACIDWESIRNIIGPHGKKIVTYGDHSQAVWKVTHYRASIPYSFFSITRHNKVVAEVETQLTGIHNAQNALAAFITTRMLGVTIKDACDAIKSFKGIERRFDFIEKGGVYYVDDYGHNPTEIRVTLEGAREKYPHRKIWCVFQPHTASRTSALLEDFAKCFNAVDHVVILDIFASARELNTDISSEKLSQKIRQNNPHVHYAKSVSQAIDYLKSQAGNYDILMTMGAGDVYKVRDSLLHN